MPIIVAHGLLGPYDELIYLAIAVIFIGFMIVSWLRSRNQVFEDEVEPGDETPATVEEASDHFKLQ